MSIALARDAECEYGRPIQLDLALRLVSLAGAEPGTYDAWACRWLARLAERVSRADDRCGG